MQFMNSHKSATENFSSLVETRAWDHGYLQIDEDLEERKRVLQRFHDIYTQSNISRLQAHLDTVECSA